MSAYKRNKGKGEQSIADILGNTQISLGRYDQWPAWSTGVPAIDAITGIGGVPKGRIVENFGPEASGKTSICLLNAAEVMKQGYKVLFLDYERALDRLWAEGMGIDFEAVDENGELMFNVATPDTL